MIQFFSTLWRDDSGQDLAEYGLLLALITVALVAIIATFSQAIEQAFQDAIDVLTG